MRTKHINYCLRHDSGVPILKCSGCSGIWLVKGQLERILKYRNALNKSGQSESVEKSKHNSALNQIANLVQSRILSLMFAGTLLAIAFLWGMDSFGISRLGIFLILPLACIWYAEGLGTLTGIRIGLLRPTITQPTPGIAVAIGGWVLMIATLGVIASGLFDR